MGNFPSATEIEQFLQKNNISSENYYLIAKKNINAILAPLFDISNSIGTRLIEYHYRKYFLIIFNHEHLLLQEINKNYKPITISKVSISYANIEDNQLMIFTKKKYSFTLVNYNNINCLGINMFNQIFNKKNK